MKSRDNLLILYLLNFNNLSNHLVFCRIGDHNISILKIIFRSEFFPFRREKINLISPQRNNLSILYKNITIMNISDPPLIGLHHCTRTRIIPMRFKYFTELNTFPGGAVERGERRGG